MALVSSVSLRYLVLSRTRDDYQGASIGLYSVDLTLTPALMLSDLTEPVFDGYSRLPLSAWTFPFREADLTVSMAHPAQKWIVGALGGSDDVFGYFVVSALGFLLWAERDPAAPVSMRLPGISYLVQPRLSCGALC